MAIAGVRVSLDVTSRTNTVQSDSATVNSVVPENAVDDLPLNGRTVVSLLRLVPGASEGLPNSINGAILIGARQPQTRAQLLASLVEQLVVHSKRTRSRGSGDKHAARDLAKWPSGQWRLWSGPLMR
jgi:hypothetical protein